MIESFPRLREWPPLPCGAALSMQPDARVKRAAVRADLL